MRSRVAELTIGNGSASSRQVATDALRSANDVSVAVVVTKMPSATSDHSTATPAGHTLAVVDALLPCPTLSLEVCTVATLGLGAACCVACSGVGRASGGVGECWASSLGTYPLSHARCRRRHHKMSHAPQPGGRGKWCAPRARGRTLGRRVGRCSARSRWHLGPRVDAADDPPVCYQSLPHGGVVCRAHGDGDPVSSGLVGGVGAAACALAGQGRHGVHRLPA